MHLARRDLRCGGNRVIGLNLNENNPVGPLPPSLFSTLTALQTFTAITGG